MPRADGRRPDQLRPLAFELDAQRHAAGSVIVSLGDTRVLCAVTVEERVPLWMRGTERGWVTAEYNMLPASTNTRTDRRRALESGRTHEIQRLIGRSLRAVVDLDALGERAFTVDCDVLQADGGTRTAAINGAWVALRRAFDHLYDKSPLTSGVAAVSVGLLDGEPLVDLCYEEDSAAEVDLNLVATEAGALIEVQGTAERAPFSPAQLSEMIELSQPALRQIFAAQQAALAQK